MSWGTEMPEHSTAVCPLCPGTQVVLPVGNGTAILELPMAHSP